MDPLTYRSAGVDIGAGDEAVRRIKRLAASTQRPEVLGGIGAFASFVTIPAGYREPVLVSSTDGVGTKLKVAFVADRSGIVTGAEIKPGDHVLGLASSGLHSNGFTLVRKAVFESMGLRSGDMMPGLGRSVADELLEPTRIYVKPVLGLLKSVPVLGMAHVTGGG